MEILKPALDVGLFTDSLEEELAFWGTDLGLQSEPRLRLGGGIHQHRFKVGDSVLKVNHSLRPLSPARSGIEAVSIRRPRSRSAWVSPGGAYVRADFRAEWGDIDLVLHLGVADVTRHRRFWKEVLSLQPEGPDCFRCGSSLVQLREALAAPRAVDWKTPGWSYITVQVRDCAAAHREALSRGAWEGEPPRRIGDAAIISFIRDPDGNFVELSQKAQLAGALPPESA